MKKGHDVRQVVQQINKDVKSKKDYIVTLNALEVTTSNNTYPNLKFTDAPDQYSLTDHSMNQLCGKLEIGTQYLRKCLPVSQELVAHNLNFWIKNTKSKELMVRTIERDSDELPNIARAVCSNRYKRIDNDVVVTHSLNKLMDLGLDIKYINYDRDTLNVTAVNPKVEGEVSEGDVVQSGVTITNSEIGSGSLMIQPFIYRLVCTNGMVVPEYLGTFLAKHVGKKLETPDADEQGTIVIDRMLEQMGM
mgnify:CR=1 FL=1